MRIRSVGGFVLLVLSLASAVGALFLLAVEKLGKPPRELAPYVERRAAGHNDAIVALGRWIARTLTTLDRGERTVFALPALRVGAQLDSSPARALPPRGRAVLVRSTEEALKAISEAMPGDEITFLPGTYGFSQQYVPVHRAGEEGNRITVRADRPGTVILEFSMIEGFLVDAPFWTFENLVIRGACKSDDDCEHAFHVVGGGTYFVARNNLIVDFNAHFKINIVGRDTPDHGLIESNTLSNTRVRQTENPVTLIDLVAASHWTVRNNLISDFVKGRSDQISYGAFAKGGGSNNVFERNFVLCEFKLRGTPGQRVGLSLGGGGTDKAACRDRRCITEQADSVIQSNLVASCSDDGIYLNKAASSSILYNTLIDTGGVEIRFAETSADVRGNLVDGNIRSRDGGLLRASENMQTSMTSLYLGLHPARALFGDAASLDFAWRSADVPRGSAAGTPDLCAPSRPVRPTYGAFEDFGKCVRQ